MPKYVPTQQDLRQANADYVSGMADEVWESTKNTHWKDNASNVAWQIAKQYWNTLAGSGNTAFGPQTVANAAALNAIPERFRTGRTKRLYDWAGDGGAGGWTIRPDAGSLREQGQTERQWAQEDARNERQHQQDQEAYWLSRRSGDTLRNTFKDPYHRGMVQNFVNKSGYGDTMGDPFGMRKPQTGLKSIMPPTRRPLDSSYGQDYLDV